MIDDGKKNFRKYQLTIWLSIQNFYSHFAKVTRKCECFGRNVEPCIDSHYDKSAMFSFLSLASETTFTFL